MIIKYSSNFDTKLLKLKKKNPQIETKIDRKLRLLSANPRHPGLRMHKIKSRGDTWSISIEMDLRILFIYRDYGIVLVDIGKHSEVY